MAAKPQGRRSKAKDEELLQLRDAALQLGISFPTIKQWIYKRKFAVFERRGDITVFRREKWTGCFSGREGKPKTSAGM